MLCLILLLFGRLPEASINLSSKPSCFHKFQKLQPCSNLRIGYWTFYFCKIFSLIILWKVSHPLQKCSILKPICHILLMIFIIFILESILDISRNCLPLKSCADDWFCSKNLFCELSKLWQGSELRNTFAFSHQDQSQKINKARCSCLLLSNRI